MTANGWARKNPDTAAEKARRAKYDSAEHKQTRDQRFAAATPLTPCGRCGRPLGPRQKTGKTGRTIGLWATPHATNGVDYLPGVWHASCNVREAAPRGARKTNATRKTARQAQAFVRPRR